MTATRDRRLLLEAQPLERTLRELIVWMSPVWETGNSDDEESADRAVKAFIDGEENQWGERP